MSNLLTAFDVANGLTAGEVSILPLDDVLRQLIIGNCGTGTSRGLRFLRWIVEDDDYYIKKLVSAEAKTNALSLMVNARHLNYSNADVDWRLWLLSFCLEMVPARVWWAYQQQIAGELRGETAALHYNRVYP